VPRRHRPWFLDNKAEGRQEPFRCEVIQRDHFFGVNFHVGRCLEYQWNDAVIASARFPHLAFVAINNHVNHLLAVLVHTTYQDPVTENPDSSPALSINLGRAVVVVVVVWVVAL
jgi:hypothetical protein